VKEHSKHPIDALAVYQTYVDSFNGDPAKGTAREWTPYRFCSQDWVLAVAAVRATRERYEVALFACEDHRDFEPDTGLKTALSFMLADSYHRTGSMELHFRGPHKGVAPTPTSGYCNSIPAPIRNLARSYNITLSSHRSVKHVEGAALYGRMVGLSSEVTSQLESASVDPTRCAFLLHRGAIGVESLELIAAFSAIPKELLEGRLMPDNWLAFKRELLLMRRGIMGERAKVVCELSLGGDQGRVSTRWKGSNILEVTATSQIDMTLESGESVTVPENVPITVLICPLDQTELSRLTLNTDTGSFSESHSFMVVPRDFRWMKVEARQKLLMQAAKNNLEVIVLLESLDELDSDILARLERFATTRSSIEEQKE
jgi:hypothetical protein